MAYTYDELNAMNVTQLRKIAEGIQHEAVHGALTMHKEKLVHAICTALGIEAHHHHHVATGVNKAELKLQIRELKKKRDALVPKDNPEEYHSLLHQIHHLKNRLRKAIQ